MKMIFNLPISMYIKSKIFSLINLVRKEAVRLIQGETPTSISDQSVPDSSQLTYITTHSLQVSKQNNILTLVLNRPEVLNAIDMELVQALRTRLQKAAIDTTVRVVVITGNGRAFCAGGDLKFALAANPEQPGDSFMALTTILHECIELIRGMQKPVIAAINGPAAGAGLFLALACDIRIMAQAAYLKVSNTSYGLSLPAGGTYTLPRLLGMSKALEIVILDRPVSAKKAYSLGLVTRVVESGSLFSQAQSLATELSQKAVHALGQIKQLMNESLTHNLNEQLLAEQEAIVKSANHREGREGLAAFLEKRTPEFTKIIQ